MIGPNWDAVTKLIQYTTVMEGKYGYSIQIGKVEKIRKLTFNFTTKTITLIVPSARCNCTHFNSILSSNTDATKV